LILISCTVQALAYCHPDQGRWINRDPLSEALRFSQQYARHGNDALGNLLVYLTEQAIGSAVGDTVSLYAICQNDPVGSIDALGLMSIDEVAAQVRQRSMRNSDIPCDSCCASGDMTGSLSGSTSQKTTVHGLMATVKTSVCLVEKPDQECNCVLDPVAYWWDCYSAHFEADARSDSQNWGAYGWSGPSGFTYAKSASPSNHSKHDDSPHRIAMLALIVFDACEAGVRHTKHLPADNGLQWEWSYLLKEWVGPEVIRP